MITKKICLVEKIFGVGDREAYRGSDEEKALKIAIEQPGMYRLSVYSYKIPDYTLTVTCQDFCEGKPSSNKNNYAILRERDLKILEELVK